MKVLIDMNLSPDWVNEFKLNGIEAVHWSDVGAFDAPDSSPPLLVLSPTTVVTPECPL